MSNKTTIKRALDALGMSGTELADLLSKTRTDGMQTTKATVSRWVNGAPVEPGVLLYLRERLERMAKSKPPSFAGCKVIGFGGGKGGSGTSTIAMMMAVLANNLGYDVRLGCDERRIIVLEPTSKSMKCPIKYQIVNLANLKQVKADAQHSSDFFFIDIGNKSLIDETRANSIDLESIDLIVTPCNPFSLIDMDPAWMVCETLSKYGYEKHLLLPAVNRLDVVMGACNPVVDQAKNFAKFEEKLCQAMIFLRCGFHSDLTLGHASRNGALLPDRDLTDQYLSLHFEIMKAIGMTATDVETNASDIEKMDLEELLAYLKY